MTNSLARFCGLGVRRGHNRIGPQHIVDAQHKLLQSLDKSDFAGMGCIVLVMALVISTYKTFGQLGCAFRLKLSKPPIPGALLNIMRVMAFGANEPALLAIARPFADALAVNALTPLPVNIAMALAAQFLRLIEADRLAEVVNQLVARGGMMAIQAPDGTASVLKIQCVGNDIVVHH